MVKWLAGALGFEPRNGGTKTLPIKMTGWGRRKAEGLSAKDMFCTESLSHLHTAAVRIGLRFHRSVFSVTWMRPPV